MVPKPCTDKALSDWRHAVATLVIANGVSWQTGQSALDDVLSDGLRGAHRLGATPVQTARAILDVCQAPEPAVVYVDPAELDRIAVA